MAREVDKIRVALVITIVEDLSDLVTCYGEIGYRCPQCDACNIAEPMHLLRQRVLNHLESLTIHDFVANKAARSPLPS